MPIWILYSVSEGTDFLFTMPKQALLTLTSFFSQSVPCFSYMSNRSPSKCVTALLACCPRLPVCLTNLVAQVHLSPVRLSNHLKALLLLPFLFLCSALCVGG